MNRLYIADDEALSREGLASFIKHNFSDIEVVGQADNGITALDEILAKKPDVVLTDVKMPGLDGIALSKRLRGLMPQLKIVFISGYDDVSFIKSALKVEAVDYIIKPIDLDELTRVLVKVVDIIKTEDTQKKRIVEMEKQLLQSMPALRQRFFAMIIKSTDRNGQNSKSSEKELRRRMEFLGIDLPYEGRFIAACVKIENIEKLSYDSEREWQLLSFGILNVFQESVDKYVRGYAFETEYGEFAAILCFDGDYENSLFELADTIDSNLKRALGVEIIMGIGCEVESISRIGDSWKGAHASVKKKMFLGASRTVSMDTIAENNNAVINEDVFNELKELLHQASYELIKNRLSELFTMMERESTEEYRTNCAQLLFQAMRFVLETDMNNSGSEQNQLKAINEIMGAETKEQMRANVQDYYAVICRQIDNVRSGRTRNVVSKIKNIIESRYSEALTINDIASEIFLTPTYVCLIFKEDTGMTLNEYITGVRMRHAKELLETTTDKLDEIAWKVGYSDASYFSKLFKRYEGELPSKFRQRIGIE